MLNGVPNTTSFVGVQVYSAPLAVSQVLNESKQWFSGEYASEADFVELQTLLNRLRAHADERIYKDTDFVPVRYTYMCTNKLITTLTIYLFQGQDANRPDMVGISIAQPGIKLQMAQYLFEGLLVG